MAVQRKVFRIEEGSALARALLALPRASSEGALRHREFMTEMQALRELIAPRAEVDRDALGARAGADRGGAGLQARAQPDLRRGRAHPRRDDRARRRGGRAASRPRAPAASLPRSSAGTERATQSILQAAEEIDQAANTLSASLKSAHDQGLAHDIQDRVVQIFEACNFQDLTGQRVSHVLETLKFVEEHVARLLAIWHASSSSRRLRSMSRPTATGISSTARNCRRIAAIPARTTSTTCSLLA